MKNLKNILFGIPIGFVNGFFGSGGGVVAVLVLKKFLKTEEKRAHATALGIILPLSLVSLFFYKDINIEPRLILLCALGGGAGGLLGARLLNKIPKKWLKIAFGAVMVISGIRMVFG